MAADRHKRWTEGWGSVTVGTYSTFKGRTLIEHWDGTSWTTVASPSPGYSYNLLTSVGVLSKSNAWAVGQAYTPNGSGYRTLVLHWTGVRWARVVSPNLGPGDNFLSSVTAVSATNIWAVGYYDDGTNSDVTLTEHWNGSAWKIVPTPNPAPEDLLASVGRIPGTTRLVAVGARSDTGSLIERRSGSSWVVDAAAPNQAGGLESVAANSISDIWAVGRGDSTALIEHWNGTQWEVVASPNPGIDNDLRGVARVSTSDVASVGQTSINGSWQTLVEDWDGATWTVSASASPSPTYDTLSRVARVPGTSCYWAVGTYETYPGGSRSLESLIESSCTS